MISEKEQLLALIADQRLRKTAHHSPLYEWMKKHHGPLSEEFEKRGPQWSTRVVVMQEVGLVDGRGKPPTVRTAQATWYRVCADIEEGKAAKRLSQEAKIATLEASAPNTETAGRPASSPRDRVRPAGYRAKPFQQPSHLVDWKASTVQRETLDDDDPTPTNPMGEKI
jgi:hypothetical protein